MSTRITRRQLLAGAASAALLAPFIRPIRKAHAIGSNKTKVIFMFLPDGCIPAQFHPTSINALPAMTQPLSAVIDHVTFLRGLEMYSGGATHEGGVAKVLTGVGPDSLDQVLGRELNRADKLPHPSIQLGVGSNFQNGSGSMSFTSGVQVKHDDDPLNAFKRIFGDPTGGGGGESAADRRRRTILDIASKDIGRVRTRLSAIEKEKLDLHLESFQEVERRLTAPPDPAAGAPPDLGGYTNNPNDFYPKTFEKEENFQRVGELQMDIAAHALAARKTRFVSFMWSHPVSPTRIASVSPIINHDASHYGSADSIAGQAFIALKRWFMDRMVYLVNKLNTLSDPDGGTLLDNTVVMLCSDLGDGNNHDHRFMPMLLLGHAAGQLRGKRVIDYAPGSAKNQPHTKLLTSIAQMAGLDINSFGFTGEGTGPLPDLLG
jgi:hypothetical protein